MLELVEVSTPVIRHGAWIIQIRLVEFFYVGRIAPKEIRVL
jgi:hypothetical protein